MKRSSTRTRCPRTDLILWNESSFLAELSKDLTVGATMDPTIKQSILTIIKDNWDSFYEKNTFRPMFDFVFCIDTGDFKAVCCRHTSYGIHERKIMDKQINLLETNDWICDCEGPWGYLILLTPNCIRKDALTLTTFFDASTLAIVHSIV